MNKNSVPDTDPYDPENPYALTMVERQVVDLLMAGLTGEEVGDLIGVDRRSVALRRSSAMRKYGARSGVHLAHLVSLTRHKAVDQFVALEDVPSANAACVLADDPAT